MVGGSGPVESISNTAGVKRGDLFVHLNYDLTNDTTVFVEAQGARTDTAFNQYYPWFYTSTAATILLPATLSYPRRSSRR